MIIQFRQKIQITAILLISISLLLAASLASPGLMAQDYEYHPLLTDKFVIGLGAFQSDSAYSISADATADTSDDNSIDLDGDLGVDNNTTVFAGSFRWRFGEKWSVAGQVFRVNATGDRVLNNDITFNDNVFQAGSSATAGIKTTVTRVFFGRVFSESAQHQFGAGLGIHNLNIKAFVEGEALLDDGTTTFRASQAETSAPLPNIGAWYMYSPARRWLVETRVDFMTANIGDYDGTLWNAQVGVNFQASRHIGIGLAYQYFDLQLNVNKTDWHGGVDLRYSGPILALTASF